MRIGLNAGHTLSGAGSGTSGVIVESIETRRVCNRLTEMFKASGVEVVPCTVDKAASQSAYLQQAVSMANRTDLDYFISIHANASENPDINGTEAYVSSTDSAAWYLAQNIVTEIVRRTSTKYNGVFSRPSLYVLKNTKMPAVLVELGYITNYEDNQRMINEPYQFAYGIYVGLLNYLGLKQ